MITITLIISGVAVFIATILVTVWYQTYSWLFRHVNKIPGPKGYPVVGNLFQIIEPPEKMFLNDRLRAAKYFPIYKFTIINTTLVCVLVPEDVELVISNMKHNKKSRVYDLLQPWLGTGLLTSEGKKWQSRRKILTPAFHFTILQEFIKIFHDETARFVKDLEERHNEPYIDVVPPVTELTLLSILETSMGTKLNFKSTSFAKYKKAVYDFGKLVTYRIVRPWLSNPTVYQFTSSGVECKNLVKTLHDFSKNVIEEKKRDINDINTAYSSRKKRAMLDLLLSYKANGADIDDEGIREEVDTFMFEGHDTTSVAISFILLTLANHQQVQEEVYREIIDVLGDDTEKLPTYADLQNLTYTERCLKETLRLFPSVPFIAREVGEDIQTSTGYLIPKGCLVQIHIYDIHRNPEIYPDPEKFDPDRFLPENTKNRHPFAYIPFSAGPRNCIGQKYAMLELKTVVCGILRKFRLEPVDKISNMVYSTDLVLRTIHGIKVKFVPRN